LNSRHGTLVNGERITEPRMVGSGDVIAVGATLLVVRRPVRPSRAGTMLEPAVLVRRLTEEASRAAQYERELAIAVVRSVEHADPPRLLAAVVDQLRAIDTAACIGAHHVAVVLPELDGAEAAQVAAALAQLAFAPLAVGVAPAPLEGIAPATLLAAARAAPDKAGPGEVMRAAAASEAIAAGSHRILVADPGMLRLYELARRLARSTIPI